MGWHKEWRALKLAAAHRFGAFLTMDNGVAYQQNPATLPLAMVILRAPSSDERLASAGARLAGTAQATRAAFGRVGSMTADNAGHHLASRRPTTAPLLSIGSAARLGACCPGDDRILVLR